MDKPIASDGCTLLKYSAPPKRITIITFLVLSFAFEARVFTTIQTFSRFLETCLSIINLSSSLNPELYEIYNNAVIIFDLL